MGIPCSGKNMFPSNIEGLPRGDHDLRPRYAFPASVPGPAPPGTVTVADTGAGWLTSGSSSTSWPSSSPRRQWTHRPNSHAVHDVFQPYLEALYLDHGYHFFAPEPEESTLLSFEAERRTGLSSAGESRTERLSPVCSTTGISC